LLLTQVATAITRYHDHANNCNTFMLTCSKKNNKKVTQVTTTITKGFETNNTLFYTS